MNAYTGWHKASYSTEQENCVEQGVAAGGAVVGVRDTKDKGQGPVLAFAPDEWASFLSELRSSDRLTGGHLTS